MNKFRALTDAGYRYVKGWLPEQEAADVQQRIQRHKAAVEAETRGENDDAS